MLGKLTELKGNFWTRLDELVEDIEELGLEVTDCNREYIVASAEDEDYVISLGGTENTIVINKVVCHS